MDRHEIEIRHIVIEGGEMSQREAQDFANAFSGSLEAALAHEWRSPLGFSSIGSVVVEWTGGAARESGQQAGLRVARAIRQGG